MSCCVCGCIVSCDVDFSLLAVAEAVTGLKAVHGFVMREKPVVISFGRAR